MFQALNPSQLKDRHVRVSKVVLFVSTLILALVLSHIHHKQHSKHHGRFSGSHSASLDPVAEAESGSGSFADSREEASTVARHSKPLDTDEDAEEWVDDEESAQEGSGAEDETIVVLPVEEPHKQKKSLSNSHSLSHMMKKHFRKHLTAPSCLATFFTLLVAVTGVVAGFSGRSCSARALIIALALSSIIHTSEIAKQSSRICRNPESADMCAKIHHLAVAMIVGSVLHHLVLLVLAIRFFHLCRAVETLRSVDESEAVTVQGVVCVGSEMEQKVAV